MFVNMGIVVSHLIRDCRLNDSGLRHGPLWERSELLWDLLRALGAAVCRDCRGLQPLFRNVMCVLLLQLLSWLKVRVNKGSDSSQMRLLSDWNHCCISGHTHVPVVCSSARAFFKNVDINILTAT